MGIQIKSFVTSTKADDCVYIRGHFTAFLVQHLKMNPLEMQVGLQCHVDDYVLRVFADKRIAAAAFDIEGDETILWDIPAEQRSEIVDDDFQLVGQSGVDLEQSIFDWTQKTFRTPLSRYAEKVKFKNGETAEKWVDERAKKFSTLIMAEINKHIDVELVDMLKDKVKTADARIYNICLAKPKVRQLFEIAPMLGSIFVEKHVPATISDYAKIPEVLLDLPLAKQIDSLWQNVPLVGDVSSVRSYVMAVKRSVLPFDRNADRLIQHLRNAAKVDYNFIRKVKTEREMLVLAAAVDRSGELANTIARDPNFAEALFAHSNGPTWNDIERAMGLINDYFSEVERENTRIAAANNFEALPAHIPHRDVLYHMTVERLWVAQEEWHRLFQRQYRAGNSWRTLSDQCDVPFPTPPVNRLEAIDMGYKLVFLKTERALHEESDAMSHCVHSYSHQVRNSSSWIFGLLVREDLEELKKAGLLNNAPSKSVKRKDKKAPTPTEEPITEATVEATAEEKKAKKEKEEEIKWARAVTVQFDEKCTRPIQTRRRFNETPSQEETQMIIHLLGKLQEPETREEKKARLKASGKSDEEIEATETVEQERELVEV